MLKDGCDHLHATRLIPFRRGTGEGYFLEFGHESIRVHDFGNPLFPTTFAAPYDIAHVFAIQHVQLNDVVLLAHPEYHPQRLSFDGSSWTIEDVPFDFAPALDVNESVIAVQLEFDGIEQWADSWVTGTAYDVGKMIQGTGAVAGRVYRCTAGHTSAAGSQPGVGASWGAVWEFVSNQYNIGDRVSGISPLYHGELFTCHTAHGAATSDAVDEPGAGSAWASYWNLGTSSATVALWASGANYTPGTKVRSVAAGGSGANTIYECKVAHTGTWLAQPGTQVKGNYWTVYWKLAIPETDLSGLSYRLAATEDIFDSSDVGTTWLLKIGTKGRATKLALATGAQTLSTAPLFIQGGYILRTNWPTNGAPYGGSIGVEESLDGVVWQQVREWPLQEDSEGNVSYEGEAPSAGAWYRLACSYTHNASADYAILEPASSILTLPFPITAYVSPQRVKGSLVLPNNQIPPASAIGVATTAYHRPAFSASQGYPRAVAFHDSRIWWAGTNRAPSRIWASHIDDFYTYLTGANEDSGLDITLAQTEANAVLWMAAHNRALIVGTTGQEWTIDGGESDAVITPTKLRARMRTRHGSCGIAPEVIAESLVWVTRDRKRIREFAYSFERDGYTAPEMTQLVGGIAGNIVQTAYQSSPSPIIWVVTDAGKLYSFTYDRDQNVVAWSEHTTPDEESPNGLAAFESVACIYNPVGGSDIVCMVVRRVAEGLHRRRIEYFDPATLDWIMADRKDTSSYVGHSWEDEGGGHPCEAIVQPFPLEFALRDGTAQGRRWRANRVTLLLHDALGGHIADSPAAPGQPIEYPAGAATPFRGRVRMHLAADWSDHTQFTITHAESGPFGLLGYVLTAEVSGS